MTRENVKDESVSKAGDMNQPSYDFWEDLSNIKRSVEEILNGHGKSPILIDFFLSEIEKSIYIALVQNFFSNLTTPTIVELNLPQGYIGKIKRRYKKDRNLAKLSIFGNPTQFDKAAYEKFKLLVTTEFPGFEKLLIQLEKDIRLRRLPAFLKAAEKEFAKCGKDNPSFQTILTTTYIEQHVSIKNCLPSNGESSRHIPKIIKDSIPKTAKSIFKTLKSNCSDMLQEQRTYQARFEKRLLKRWAKAINPLEALIRASLESGVEHATHLGSIVTEKIQHKNSALIQIHARSVQIANEILALLKSGYSDGANARWRSLHELAVVALFLRDQSNEISHRYLDHEVTKTYKNAKDYKTYARSLGYSTIPKKEFNAIEVERNRLCSQYGRDFHKDFHWIPFAILKDRTFRGLAKHVKLGKFSPFVNLSNDSVHSGAKGFYRLGLMDHLQGRMLLAGATNYGLADPIQNTAISLLHATGALLMHEPTMDSTIQFQILYYFLNEICPQAAAIQFKIEQDEQCH